VLGSGSVAAIGVWQPIADQARLALPGSRAVYTSAQAPGLIFDGLAVNPESLKERPQDWLKVIQVWYRVLAYLNDPKTRPEALAIMAARDGVTPKIYQRYVKGTHILSLEEAKEAFVKSDALLSIYGSDENADAFNVRNGVYKTPQDISEYVDPSLIENYKAYPDNGSGYARRSPAVCASSWQSAPFWFRSRSGPPSAMCRSSGIRMC
jgi:NitT/TauT family transport system substrate-binding protein